MTNIQACIDKEEETQPYSRLACRKCIISNLCVSVDRSPAEVGVCSLVDVVQTQNVTDEILHCIKQISIISNFSLQGR